MESFVKEFLKEHSERVTLIGVGIAFMLCVGGGVYLQKKKHRDINTLPEVNPRKIELKIPKNNSSKNKTQTSQQTTSFFLKPSPAELMEQLAAMEELNENVANAKLSGLRVMWPVYFFEAQEPLANKVTVLFDVSEDGFGAMINCEVDIAVYPEITTLESGKKIWIAGEILDIDPTGTGTIYIKAEHLKFRDDGDLTQVLPNKEIEK